MALFRCIGNAIELAKGEIVLLNMGGSDANGATQSTYVSGQVNTKNAGAIAAVIKPNTSSTTISITASQNANVTMTKLVNGQIADVHTGSTGASTAEHTFSDADYIYVLSNMSAANNISVTVTDL